MTSQPYPAVGLSGPAQYTDALRRGIAAVPRCRECDHRFFYPRFVCPWCSSDDLELSALPGPWTVRSRTSVERPQAAVFRAWTPVLVLAAANAGVTIVAEGHGWPAAAPPAVGSPVTYHVTQRPDGTPLPVFSPVEMSVE